MFTYRAKSGTTQELAAIELLTLGGDPRLNESKIIFRCKHFTVMNIKKTNREKYPEIADMIDNVRRHCPDAKVMAIRPHGTTKFPATREADE